MFLSLILFSVPFAHTQRDYIQDYKAGHRGAEGFTDIIMLQLPRMFVGTQSHRCTLSPSLLWYWHHIKTVFSGENRQTGAKAFWKASCHLLKILVSSCLWAQLRTSQGHHISLSWPSRKLCTTNSRKSLHLKLSTFLNRSLLCWAASKFSGIQVIPWKWFYLISFCIDFCDGRAGMAFQKRKSIIVAGFR